MHYEETRTAVDDEGNPIKRLVPKYSRFAEIEVRHSGDDRLEVLAKEGGTGEVQTFELDLTKELYKGVASDEHRRRDVDDDIQDALQEVSYTLVDRNE